MEWLNSIDWVKVGVGYVLFIQVMKAVRDVLDKTPATDDNAWERACTIIVKLGETLLTGKRPS